MAGGMQRLTMTQQRDPLTYQIIGAAFAVHAELGAGFLEAVYQEAFEVELKAREIPYIREHLMEVKYRGTPLRTRYKVDFVCCDGILVELKALTTITGLEEAQVLNYLKASGLTTALLLNFGSPSLQYRRLVF